MIALAAVAGFTTQMRVGSLEITAALAAVAVLAARPRVRAAAEIGTLTPMQVDFEIVERGGRRRFGCAHRWKSAARRMRASRCTIPR